MSGDVITQVEDDLVATLTAAVAGLKLRVQDLPGDWDDDMLRRLLTLAPCVLVAFTGGAPISKGALLPVISGQWAIYAVTSHPSGEAARRRGNAQAIGAYELISRVIVPTLHNHTVPGVGTLTMGAVENLFTGMVEKQGLTVYAVGFSLPMSFEVDNNAASLAWFTTLAAQYDVPPFDAPATHAEWLAANYTHGTPDAQDNVILPTGA